MAKVDIKSVFRLLSCHPSAFHLLGFVFGDCFYFDKCMPMGCAISCAYFEMFSTFLHWVVVQRIGLLNVVHYLDNFLFVGPLQTGTCEVLLDAFMEMSCDFGIPLAAEKTEDPGACLTFLGTELDMVALVVCLP